MESRESGRVEESLTSVATLEEILRCATIDMLWRVRHSIRFCLSSCDVRSKGEAFPSGCCKLKKFNVVQPKVSIILLFIREMLRPYKCQQNHSGTGLCTSSKFPVPNSQSIHVTNLIIRGASHGF